MGKRKRYSTEFKLEAVAMAKQPGVTKTQIAREPGFNAKLQTWIDSRSNALKLGRQTNTHCRYDARTQPLE